MGFTGAGNLKKNTSSYKVSSTTYFQVTATCKLKCDFTFFVWLLKLFLACGLKGYGGQAKALRLRSG